VAHPPNVYSNRLQPVLLSATNPTATVLSLCYDFHSHTALNFPPCNFSASTAGDNGNVYQIVNNRDSNRTQNFVYDNRNRILQGYTSGTNWGEDFTIDAWANLTNRSLHAGKTNYESLAAPALTSNQLTGFGYDAAGNITSNGTIGYNYSQENRLTNFITNITDIYIYDGDGERVKKSVPAVTLYWYGATGDVLDETGATGTLVSEYIFFNGKRVARRDADNTVKYYFADNLGSASVITNASGAMPPLEESDYFPYGGEIQITSGDPNHYKFTGKERDTESGLDNFGARYFTSNLGRFMTPDWAVRPTNVPYAVFGDPQSLNLYTYVENAPLNRVDADGHYDVIASGCAANNRAKCQKKYDKATDRFEKARQKDLNSKDSKVRAAAAAYGDRGAKNGVHVGFEDLHGQEIKGSVDAMNSGKGKLIDVEVKIDEGLKGKSLQETVAHEGSHVGDDINFLTSYNFATQHYDPAANFTGQQTEFHGYQAGAGVTHEHGFGPNDADKINEYIQNNYDPNYLNNNYFPNNNNFPQ